MVILTLSIFANLKNQGIQSFPNPSDGPELFREVRALVQNSTVARKSLSLPQTQCLASDLFSAVRFSCDRNEKPHWYNSYTIILSPPEAGLTSPNCRAKAREG
jgi:hypothetical protein